MTHKDYCVKCKSNQEVRRVEHASGTEWICKACGGQTDFDHADVYEDDWNEPVGSCDDCGVNLYIDDDMYFCDQCLWYRSQEWSSNEQQDRHDYYS